MSENSNKVLLSPLDWGLGHAARCVPLIRQFHEKGCQVSVFASKELCKYLSARFPDLTYIIDQTRSVSYGLHGTDFFRLTGLALKIKNQVKKEQAFCADICAKEKYDLIVSDNRYGFRSNDVKSVLITHQLMPIPPRWLSIGMPFLKRFLIRSYASFSEVWIPDFADYPGLAGRLSHPSITVPNSKYIGPLSRFEKNITEKYIRKTDSVLVIASGPEKHRCRMAAQLSQLFSGTSLHINIAGAQLENGPFNTSCFVSPSDEELKQMIFEAGIIISHSGYSTLMDLFVCGRSAVIFPTPGQTEQKYLAQLHRESFLVVNKFSDLKKYQDDFNQLSEILLQKEKFFRSGFAHN